MYLRTISIGVLLLASCVVACKDGEEDGEEPEQPDAGQGAQIDPEVVVPDLAALLCDSSAGCDCRTGPAEAAACVDAITPAVAGAVSTGQSLGLRYHDECLGPMTAYAEALGCRSSNEIQGDEELSQLQWEAQRCKMLVGEASLGEPCVGVGGDNFGSSVRLGDSCAQGLSCQGVCLDLVEAPGEPCAFGLCPPGNDCIDPDADGVLTCESPPAAGQRCNPHGFVVCDGGLVCDPMELVCIELPGPGEACVNGQCRSGSLCVSEVCEALAGEGEPCVSFGCADGLRCDLATTTCVRKAAEGEECFFAEDCAAGLTCDQETLVCTPLPGEGEDCLFGLCATELECALDNTCTSPPAIACELPFCIYRVDGLCDEPEGTGLCVEGTDPEDCMILEVPAAHR
jgi:hypothetical protein